MSDELLSFVAAERALSRLSAYTTIVNSSAGENLWSDADFRAAIATEWEAVKRHMQGAGFE
ncbi:hypothetical protein AR457_38195 [Streptomyces agglomeratus]|uniref:hypothetical protein n=1 Tax=Streptomyces agglomeratus TaxID=285458 RepID=UPI0008543812|nr:hypothetical protein [Streptomyces agglomeratus]OEJ23031.1 hypothetical protein AR457_38195 [Streptomyces agglomeratus]